MLRMTPDQLEAFLTEQRTARIGTISPNGEPHVVPMWFVWHDGAIFMNTLKRARRTRDIETGSRVAVCIDAGYEYAELCGAVLYGSFEDVAESADVRKLFGEKYWNGMDIPEVKSHRWIVMRPDKIVSWDFKKIPANRDPRLRTQA
jgi:nitroimidazol reductase NimA-like FMN-containing flavoprotein (pyridoxamine 5'-phosphate oxidase superfamily)